MPRTGQSKQIVLKQIVLRCALEKAGCIKADGDGGWEIKLSVPDSESELVRKLSEWRLKGLIAVFVQSKDVRS